MYLDSVEILEDTDVDMHGEHTLEIVGAGGYKTTVTFSYDNPNLPYVWLMVGLAALALILAVGIVIIRRRVL